MELRPARPGDELAVAEVHVRSWQHAYAGLLPAALLEALDPVERASRYVFGSTDRTSVLAVAGDRVCGFATHGAARDADAAADGEVMSIYVDPAYLGRGIGRTLMADARSRLVAGGFGEAVLWVLVGNDRAAHFYERDGWRRDGSRRPIDTHGVRVDEVRYRRSLATR